MLRDDFQSKLPIVEQRIQADAAAGKGEEANHWRRADFFIRSILGELEMWLAIHSNDGSTAWDASCSALQHRLSDADFIESPRAGLNDAARDAGMGLPAQGK